MRALIRRSAVLASSLTEDLVILLWADGLQGTARRNAWSGMVADSRRARDRADAETATEAASAQHVAVPELVAATGS
jgi:hypothetical protein